MDGETTGQNASNAPTIHGAAEFNYAGVEPGSPRFSGRYTEELRKSDCPMCMNKLRHAEDCHCCAKCCEASGWECGNVSVNSYPREEIPEDAEETSSAHLTPEQVVEALGPMDQFMEDVKKFEFGCAICNRKIEDDKVFGMVLIWPVNERGENDEQTWWVHRGCFVQMLHPFFRQMRDEE